MAVPGLVVVAVALSPPAGAEPAAQPSAVAAGELDLGGYHSCTVVPAASLRCWGYGGDGALGYGNRATIGDDETPAAAGPVDVGAGVRMVAAGSVHTCAVLDDSAVRCWGFGGNGRLGLSNTADVGDDEPPSTVGTVDLGTGRTASAITAGRAHTCAALDDGTVRCWGFALDGRVGYPDLDPDPATGPRPPNIGDDETPGSVGPVVLGAGRTAVAVSAGDSHTCALLDDGSVRCWGSGAQGQLGYGTTTRIGDDERPAAAGPVDLGAGRSAVALTAGDFHTCALLDDGAVACWGYGGNGRLGYGGSETIGDDETPASVGQVQLGAGAKAISAGAAHTCALLDDGRVSCWGSSASGQLGYGSRITIGDDETPASAGTVDLGAGRTAVAIAAGSDHTCARLDDGSTRCWGRAVDGQLGYCSQIAIGDDETPATAGPVDLGIAGIAGAACPLPASPPPAVPAPAPPAPPPPAPPAVAAVAAGDGALAAALQAQSRRRSALRDCRASAAKRARAARARARRRHDRQPRLRARTLRAIARTHLQRRQQCLRRFGRIPGRVTSLAVRASSRTSVVVRFRAPGTHGSRPPAATGYVVRQSSRPIRTARDFARAPALCQGTCRFAVTQVGAQISLTVIDLRPGTTYHFAVAARDNVSGRSGARSKGLSVRTRGTARPARATPRG